MKHILPLYAVLAAISFLLHLAWERAHIGLYTGYGALEGVLPVYLFSTFGDVLYTLFAVAIAHTVFGLRALSARYYGLLAVMGLCIAVFVEVKAAYLDRWEYTDAMPLIQGMGISPLVQMTVLLPLSVYITIAIMRRIGVY